MQRQAEAARSIYEAFLVRAKETMEAANVDTTNARIITRALPPLQKSWPPTLLLVLGAGFLGLSLGASGGLAHEYLRPTLFTPRQASDLIDAPALGVIAGRDLAGGRSADRVARLALRALGEDDTPGPAIGHCLYLASPRSAARARAGLAERIAALAAEDGREVLLIDGDLADGGGERPGLLDLFRGDQTIAELAYREGEEGFVRLAKGVGDPLQPTRAGADAFRLRRVRRCYDLVVIDGGASAENLRLAPLAAQADFVLLVAEIGGLQAGLVEEAEAARVVGAHFDAVALVDPGA